MFSVISCFWSLRWLLAPEIKWGSCTWRWRTLHFFRCRFCHRFHCDDWCCGSSRLVVDWCCWLSRRDVATSKFHRRAAGQLLVLNGRVLVNKLVYREETSTNSDHESASWNFKIDLRLAEFVDPSRFTIEHHLQLTLIRIWVEIFGQLLVDGVTFDRMVELKFGFQFNYIRL